MKTLLFVALPTEVVAALNKERRHLSDEQKSVAALNVKDSLKAEARERQRAGQERGRDARYGKTTGSGAIAPEPVGSEQFGGGDWEDEPDNAPTPGEAAHIAAIVRDAEEQGRKLVVDSGEEGRARQLAAKITGVSTAQIRRLSAVRDAATPHPIFACPAGEHRAKSVRICEDL